MNKLTELYACLYVREFPTQSLLRLRPERHEKPCVIMEGEPPFEVVCSLNAKARLLGLRHGMTRVEVDTFAGAIVLARSNCLSGRSTVQVVPQGREAEALSFFPLTVLGLPESQAETFAMWGIRTLGMLAALPERELIARTGQEGKRLRELACGELPHLFQPIEIPFVLEERAELDFPLEDLESLFFGVSTMLEQIILRARARIMGLSSITITLHLDGSGSHSRTVRPAQPSDDRQLWLKLLHLDLEAHPPRAAILKVLVHAEPGSTSKMQLGLFSNISTAAGGGARAYLVSDPFAGGGTPDPTNPSLASCPAKVRTKMNYFNPCAFRNPLPGETISDATHPVGSVNPDGVPVLFQGPVRDTATAIRLLGGPQNNIYGPGYYQVNMSLFKSFATIREQQLQFRADAFNVLNHPTLGTPNGSMNANGGLISGPKFFQNNTPDARFFQLSLKYTF